jgi:fructose-1,6-bisphosphatase-3
MSTTTLSSVAAERAALQVLSRQVPTLDAALAEIARLRAELTLPRGTIHVISDVHGEDVKLRHVINNASGTLRPLVERLFADRLNPDELREFVTLIFYPRESLDRIAPTVSEPDRRRDFCRRTLRNLFELLRTLARRYSRRRVESVFPAEYAGLFAELLARPAVDWGSDYVDALVDSVVEQDRGFELIRRTVRVVRNLTIDELILAGDCWDRGPRGDRVVDYLMH